jgi:uncharacterized protein (UPF0276 family)
LIDTHGAEVCDSVWQLLQHTYQVCGVKPTLLERDFNIPSWQALQDEMTRITIMQQEGGNENRANIFPSDAAAVL